MHTEDNWHAFEEAKYFCASSNARLKAYLRVEPSRHGENGMGGVLAVKLNRRVGHRRNKGQRAVQVTATVIISRIWMRSSGKHAFDRMLWYSGKENLEERDAPLALERWNDAVHASALRDQNTDSLGTRYVNDLIGWKATSSARDCHGLGVS